MPLAHQLINITLLLLQVGLYPYLIGIEEFGTATLVLAPLYFAQALAEPFFQAVFNKKSNLAVNFFTPAMVSGISLALFLSFSIRFLPDRTGLLYALLIAFVVSYTYFTALQSALIASGKLYFVVVGGSSMVLAYLIIALAASDLGYVAVIMSGTIGFFIASIIYLGCLLAQRTLSFSYHNSLKDIGTASFVLGTVLFRLPTIFISSGFIIIMGLFSVPSSIVGTVKILMSASSAGRYANLVPLAILQARLAAWVYRGETNLLKRTMSQYAVSLTIFVLLFPSLFYVYISIVGGAYPSVWILFIIPFFTLIQPLSYYYFVLKDHDGKVDFASFLLLALVLMAGSIGFLYIDTPPLTIFAGMILFSIAIISTLLISHKAAQIK